MLSYILLSPRMLYYNIIISEFTFKTILINKLWWQFAIKPINID